MTAREKSALCLNLARGCEKQYQPVEAGLFKELADHFAASAQPAASPAFGQLTALVDRDLEEGFPGANAVSAREKDRGALRALVWGEKVTRMHKSILGRYEKSGPESFENTNVWVCTICGFIFAGDELPELCPVCKVPNWKFEKVEGGQGK
jgi:rubrerythrin